MNALPADLPTPPRARCLGKIALRLIATLMTACASTPRDPVGEKLDPDTGTTLIVLTRPIELLSPDIRGATNDPFAYIAPFETDRMGERALFLWVSAPQEEGFAAQPQVLCNDQPLQLQPVSTSSSAGPDNSAGGAESSKVDISQLSVSRPPYVRPVPWNGEWYFQLPADALKCLTDAQSVSLEVRTSTADKGTRRFSTDHKNLAPLVEFSQH